MTETLKPKWKSEHKFEMFNSKSTTYLKSRDTHLNTNLRLSLKGWTSQARPSQSKIIVIDKNDKFSPIEIEYFSNRHQTNNKPCETENIAKMADVNL